jgi:hypothetical protein
MDDALAFRNRDGSVVAVLRNARASAAAVNVSVEGASLSLTLDADSYNTVAFAAPGRHG